MSGTTYPKTMTAADAQVLTDVRSSSERLASTSARLAAGSFPRLANLGLLGALAGGWTGYGFNLIWRPHFPAAERDHFLQLNLTKETLDVRPIGGPIPNRGLIEPDITLFGMHYLQQISDNSFPPPQGGGGLHLEPGVWLTVPTNVETPASDPSAVRMGTIPHGTTILAQGTAFKVPGPPVITPVSIVPFPIDHPDSPFPFPTSKLGTPSPFRTDPLPAGITQPLVDDPNSFLADANASNVALGWNFVETTVVVVASKPDGGTDNIPFLAPNADASDVTATFWVSLLENATGEQFVQLQYTQTVLLNFASLSWPHVTVGSLVLTA